MHKEVRHREGIIRCHGFERNWERIFKILKEHEDDWVGDRE